MDQLLPLNPYSAELEDLGTRRKYAELLRAQSMQPLQGAGMAGRTVAPISLAQGFAQLLRGGVADATDQQVTGQRRALSDRYQKETQDTLAQALAKARGGDALGGAQQMAGSPNPVQQGIGYGAIGQEFLPPKPYVVGHSLLNNKGQVIGTDPTFAQQKEEDRKAREQNLIMQLAQSANDKEAQRAILIQLKQMGVDSAMALKQAALAARPADPVTAVTIQDPNDPNGTIVIDGRTKQVLGKGAKLTDAGKLENKRQFNMQGIGQTIQEAEDILTNKVKPPTGSGIGSAVDTVAGVFGATPSGAAEAQRLKAVGGALVSKMPRMEGPQSDKDVALYKEMAGMVGDSTVPVERRVAALDEVKKLWAKYERLNPDAFAERRAGGEPPPGAVRPR